MVAKKRPPRDWVGKNTTIVIALIGLGGTALNKVESCGIKRNSQVVASSMAGVVSTQAEKAGELEQVKADLLKAREDIRLLQVAVGKPVGARTSGARRSPEDIRNDPRSPTIARWGSAIGGWFKDTFVGGG